MKQYNSPLAVQQADPYIIKRNGKYYFVATHPEYDRIELREADCINDITNARRKTIWTCHKQGEMCHPIWAPELHYIMGKWVIYFTAGEEGKRVCLRPYALICDSEDPMTGSWTEAGKLKASEDDPYSFRDFAIDMTVFENKGKWYLIWAQKSGKQFDVSELYMAELETPTKLKSARVTLSTPDYDWERRELWINEGPSVMKHGGKIYVSYSASTTGAHYCMGLLSCSENDDVMDPNCWSKRNKPVLQTVPELGVYGPGHNCFVEGDEGEQLCVLHFRNYRDIKGDPLDDHNRHAHVIKVEFDEKDEPVFAFRKEELYNVPFENEVQAGLND
ncbi:MAG: family 43 glycosylhydrolase [Clostridia bacterium]|nr:family 43 glycosylhydrolase [Clostridia bacterium]